MSFVMGAVRTKYLFWKQLEVDPRIFQLHSFDLIGDGSGWPVLPRKDYDKYGPSRSPNC